MSCLNQLWLLRLRLLLLLDLGLVDNMRLRMLVCLSHVRNLHKLLLLGSVRRHLVMMVLLRRLSLELHRLLLLLRMRRSLLDYHWLLRWHLGVLWMLGLGLVVVLRVVFVCRRGHLARHLLDMWVLWVQVSSRWFLRPYILREKRILAVLSMSTLWSVVVVRLHVPLLVEIGVERARSWGLWVRDWMSWVASQVVMAVAFLIIVVRRPVIIQRSPIIFIQVSFRFVQGVLEALIRGCRGKNRARLWHMSFSELPLTMLLLHIGKELSWVGISVEHLIPVDVGVSCLRRRWNVVLVAPKYIHIRMLSFCVRLGHIDDCVVARSYFFALARRAVHDLLCEVLAIGVISLSPVWAQDPIDANWDIWDFAIWLLRN